MNVKDAVRAAKQYVAELFADEGLSDLGLEEVEFDDAAKVWKVTIGFSRPWDRTVTPLTAIARGGSLPRSYKVVRIDDATGTVKSVKEYEKAA
jgi:hypothetical protein